LNRENVRAQLAGVARKHKLMEKFMGLSRRAFIENDAILIATVGASSIAWSDSAPMLSESDPTALVLGYKAKASSVDTAKFAQYAPGQACSNCALYQGAEGSSSGPCAIFPGKAVSSQGWCASYAKKG
jgi:hypothetical protein